MKRHTKRFNDFQLNEHWDTVNMGGRDINVIGLPPAGRPGRGGRAALYALLVDGDVADVFTSEMDAVEAAMDLGDQFYGQKAMELAQDMGVEPEDVEAYEEILFDMMEEHGRIQIDQTDARGLLEIVGSPEDLMAVLRDSSLDQHTANRIYSEATGG